MAPMLTSYPPSVGCYVDGARGIYAVDAIVALAEAHGFEAKGCDDWNCPRCHYGQHEKDCGAYTEWGHCLSASEVEDEATEYMNDEHAVEGCHWGRSEQGDWGLWPIEIEERICPTGCGMVAQMHLFRVTGMVHETPMYDERQTVFCEPCGEDALESGLYCVGDDLLEPNHGPGCIKRIHADAEIGEEEGHNRPEHDTCDGGCHPMCEHDPNCP